MKNKDKFFEGVLSTYFAGHPNLYIGDKDFVFADEQTNYIGEIKTISAGGTFTGKKANKKQLREYVANQGKIDNFGRINQALIIEYHKYEHTPYVVIVPLVFKDYVSSAEDYLDYNNARMLYVNAYDQLSSWFAGDKTQGRKPKRKLICI